MHRLCIHLAACLIGVGGFTSAGGTAAVTPTHEFFGVCDGSALVMLDDSHFAVANDEDNILRIYKLSQTSSPVWQRDFSSFLQLARKSPEADLEGAARIGDVIYWISSHARNTDGKERPNRQRFFATRIVKSANGFELEPFGKPLATLLNALLDEPKLRPFNLTAAARRAPEADGALNIEGLAATPEGGLLIAFRKPVPSGKALLVPMENPAAVIQGAAPRFGEAIQLDLDGRGIRDIVLAMDRYFLIAGPTNGKGDFTLYEWTSSAGAATAIGFDFGKLKPEGLALLSNASGGELLCTTDDGGRQVDDCDCKDLKDASRRSFRTIRLRL